MAYHPYDAKALFDYDAVESTEMTIVAGDVLTVEENNDSGWCLVRMGDRTGWVPADYVERMDDDEDVDVSPEPEAYVEPFAEQNDVAEPPAAQSDAVEQITQSVNKVKITPHGDEKLCHACGEIVDSAFVVAKDKTFHADHFRCDQCNNLLGGKPFIEKDGKFFCEEDYYTAFNPKCGHCLETIKGQYISALDQSWHPEHFVCAECSQPFTGNQFRKHDNRPYCEEHFRALFAEKCAKCQKTIDGQVFEALDKKFHLECFACEMGHAIGEGINFHLHNENVYCPDHFEELFLQRCGGCTSVIKGQYLKVLDKHYHPGCWNCKKCGSGISADTCSQHNADFYCKSCIEDVRSGAYVPTATGPKQNSRAQPAAAAAAPVSSSSNSNSNDASPAQPSAVTVSTPGQVVYSYSALKNGDYDESAINTKKKEQYLADDVFERMFGCSKEAFYKLPRWKQQAKKKELMLF